MRSFAAVKGFGKLANAGSRVLEIALSRDNTAMLKAETADFFEQTFAPLTATRG